MPVIETTYSFYLNGQEVHPNPKNKDLAAVVMKRGDVLEVSK